MSYFESSSRKRRSKEDDVFMPAAEMVHQRKRVTMQMIEQPSSIVSAIEKPKVGVEGGDWTMPTKKRGDDGLVLDKESEFRSPSSVLSVDLADWFVIGSDEFLLDGYGGGGALDMSLVDYGLVEQMCLGWLPCSDADLMTLYGDGDCGDLGQMSLWEDDIWRLRDIHETPTREEF